MQTEPDFCQSSASTVSTGSELRQVLTVLCGAEALGRSSLHPSTTPPWFDCRAGTLTNHCPHLEIVFLEENFPSAKFCLRFSVPFFTTSYHWRFQPSCTERNHCLFPPICRLQSRCLMWKWLLTPLLYCEPSFVPCSQSSLKAVSPKQISPLPSVATTSLATDTACVHPSLSCQTELWSLEPITKLHSQTLG